MRPSVLLFLLFIIGQSAAAQFLPTLETDKVWTHSFFDTWTTRVGTYAYRCAPDTVINGQTYWRNYVARDSVSLDFELQDYHWSHMWREDSLGRLYRYLPHDSTEYLAIDYTLSVGDTLPAWNDWDCPATVSEVGTVILMDGIERRKLTFVSGHGSGQNYEVYAWIEGIGNTRYALNTGEEALNCIVDGIATPPNCVRRNGELIYDNPDLPGCFYTDTEQLPDQRWSLSPNPTSDRIALRTDLPVHRIEVYDLHGRLVSSTRQSAEIDLQALPAGPYVLRAWLGEYAPVQRLVVKQ